MHKANLFHGGLFHENLNATLFLSKMQTPYQASKFAQVRGNKGHLLNKKTFAIATGFPQLSYGIFAILN
jgi:hypothetical protein